MDGIGYNPQEIKNLTSQMNGALSGLKLAMEESYPSLVSTFRANWVGVDEYAFETKFSEVLTSVYSNCDHIIGAAARFVVEAGKTWAEWQANVAAGWGGPTGQRPTIEEYIHQEQTLELPVQGELSIPENAVLGLTSGSAANNLQSAMDTYVENVQRVFNLMNDKIEAGKAFVGPEQTSSMNSFITDLNGNMGSILGEVTRLKENIIPALVQGYTQQQSQIAADASTASSTISEAASSVN